MIIRHAAEAGKEMNNQQPKHLSAVELLPAANNGMFSFKGKVLLRYQDPNIVQNFCIIIRYYKYSKTTCLATDFKESVSLHWP